MTTTDPTSASMGGPLSEAEQLRAENAKLLRKLELANKHRQHSIESRRKLERKLIGWREAAESAAKERDGARARVGVLEGQLATTQAEATDMRAALHRRLLQVKSIRRDGHTPIDPMLCTTPVTTVEEEIEDARLWWTAVGNRNGALGLDGGDPDER